MFGDAGAQTASGQRTAMLKTIHYSRYRRTGYATLRDEPAVTNRPLLGGLTQTEMVTAFNHPEQRRNLHVIANLLTQMDSARHLPLELYNFQASLFRASYRAQTAAADINRALKRLAGGKGPDWQGQHDADALRYLEPRWTPASPIDSRNRADWEFEAVVAARIVHQLREVGDGLAWRVYGFNRGLITALADHSLAGPIVPKKGLGAELGRIAGIFHDTGHFTLMHDLTTVLRHHDLTEVHASGFRELHEVKATLSNRARSDSSKQRRALEAALEAAVGDGPLRSSAYITRGAVQLRTHVRDLSGVLAVAQRDGLVVTRIADRMVSVLHLPTIARLGSEPSATWDRYQDRRHDARQQFMPTAINLLTNKMTFADRDERNPFLAPFSVFPLSVAHRTALICDLVLVETTMDVQALADGFSKSGVAANVLLNYASRPGADVLEVITGDRRMVVHSAAITQLLYEMVRTDCFAKAFVGDYRSSGANGKFVTVFNNERAAWR